MTELFIWLGILFCAAKAAMFSGLNLAYFSVPYLRLKILASDDPKAATLLKLREDSNFLLATILWGNVAYNVLLTLLTSSVLTGVASFLFSTIVLTLVGEIMPQATFSRSALKFGAMFAPVIRFYQFLLYPIAKPTAYCLNKFLGPIRPDFYEEADLVAFIQAHMDTSYHGDISPEEGKGAMAFLRLDDTPVAETGTVLKSEQIQKISKSDLSKKINLEDKLVQKLLSRSQDQFVLLDESKKPMLVLNFNKLVTDLERGPKKLRLKDYCKKLVLVTDKKKMIGEVLKYFQKDQEVSVVYWKGKSRKIVRVGDLWRLLT